MDKWECTVCDYIYSPELGDPSSKIFFGTLFEDIPDDWICPECGASKNMFNKIRKRNFEELNMAKCKDGRKHVVVSGYEKKAGVKVSKYERSCPNNNFKQSDDVYFCCVCDEECNSNDFHNINIKGETKTICNECVDIIHGLI